MEFSRRTGAESLAGSAVDAPRTARLSSIRGSSEPDRLFPLASVPAGDAVEADVTIELDPEPADNLKEVR
jgi:hypothetical protein